MSSRIDRPTRAQIARIAENQPGLLNLLVAYFVLEWQEVRIGNPAHGIDQDGKARVVPDYVTMWRGEFSDGVDVCAHYLMRCPARRQPDGPGFLSEWLGVVSSSTLE